MSDKITVSQLEQQIFEKEEVRVVIRASTNVKVDSYQYERKASSSTSVSSFIDQRIKPLVGNAEVSIINGDSNNPHGRTKMETLRNSYSK